MPRNGKSHKRQRKPRTPRSGGLAIYSHTGYSAKQMLDNGMQAQLVRSIIRVNLDASGNVSYFVRVRDVELDPRYVNLQALFTEVKILSMKITVVPTTTIRNSALQMGTLFSAIVHENYTTLSSIGDTVRAMPSVRYHSTAALSSFTRVWKPTPGDSTEQQFFSNTGTTVGRVIPAEIGGLIFWCDGPISQAGAYVYDLIVEWNLLYRGMRLA